MRLRYFYLNGGINSQSEQILFRYANAFGDGETERYDFYLGGVLRQIAQSITSCDHLLTYLNEVESGLRSEVETGGNDVTLHMKLTGVQVDININDDWVGQPEGRFTLAEWKKALIGWRTFLEMPRALGTSLEIEL